MAICERKNSFHSLHLNGNRSEWKFSSRKLKSFSIPPPSHLSPPFTTYLLTLFAVASNVYFAKKKGKLQSYIFRENSASEALVRDFTPKIFPLPKARWGDSPNFARQNEKLVHLHTLKGRWLIVAAAKCLLPPSPDNQPSHSFTTASRRLPAQFLVLYSEYFSKWND